GLAALSKKRPAPATTGAGLVGSVFARQVNHVVGEIQRDLVKREIGEFDFLGVDDVAVAVVAGERCGVVGPDSELPDLALFGGNALVVRLDDGDFIKQPVGAGGVGNVLRAVGEQ